MSGKSVFAAVLAALAVMPGSAFQTRADYITFGNGAGSKWGDRQHGTPSGTITWSFMNDGTTLYASHPLIAEVDGGVSSTSDITTLRSTFDGLYGANTFNTAVQNAFNTWSAAAPGRIVFQHVADNGATGGDPNDAASSAVDIRIGAFHSAVGSGFAGLGAVGYGPPGDAINFPDALAGDILINLDSLFIRAAGSEDDVFYTGGSYQNDLEGLLLHELGHAAIGLGHSTDGPNSPGLGDVMYVDNFPDCCSFINRQLSAQDLAGARSVYGAVPEPTSLWTLALVSSCCWATRRRRHPPWKN